ncbi:4-hydroxybenzoate octaprenyltransferase [Enterobacteriaceae bacterium LUAb1]
MEHTKKITKFQACCRLMRIDKPIGALLLLWPTLWALWLSANGFPPLKVVIVFILGVFIMRAAGCVINDFADRRVDRYVKRTRHRPLASGALTTKEAKYVFIVLVCAAFALVLTMNMMTIWLSFAGLALACTYPFMKRYTHLPQVILGMAFGWSIPMGWAAVSHTLPLSCWLLFLANIFWTVAYDTQYAMVDRDDDLKIGVKSTAILFGRFDKLIIASLQLATLIILMIVGLIHQLGGTYYCALLVAGGLFICQQKMIASRDRQCCFRAFLNNNYVGLVVFIGIAFSLM